MENLLKKRGSTDSESSSQTAPDVSKSMSMDVDNSTQLFASPDVQIDPSLQGSKNPMDTFQSANLMPDNLPQPAEAEYAFEMIGLGLEEPLPPQDVIAEL